MRSDSTSILPLELAKPEFGDGNVDFTGLNVRDHGANAIFGLTAGFEFESVQSSLEKKKYLLRTKIKLKILEVFPRNFLRTKNMYNIIIPNKWTSVYPRFLQNQTD